MEFLLINKSIERLKNTLRVLILSSILVPAYSSAINTQQAFDQLDKKSKSVLQRIDALSAQQLKLMKEINQRLELDQHVRGGVGSSLLQQLGSNGEGLATASEQYINHINEFMNEIDKKSPCYQPDFIDQLNENILKQKEIAAKIKNISLAGMSDESAVVAILGIVSRSAEQPMLLKILPAFRICQVAEIVDGLGLDIPPMEAEIQPEADKSAIEQIYEPYQDSYTWEAGEEFHVGDILPVDIREQSQLSEIIISSGVTIDAGFYFVLPPSVATQSSQNHAFSITGQVSEGDTTFELNITVTRQGTVPITALSFENSSLKRCVDEHITLSQAEYTKDILTLSCRFLAIEPIDLAPLTQLNGLEVINFKGGQFTGGESIFGLSKLQSVTFDSAKLDQLALLEHGELSYMLINTSVAAWGNLLRSKGIAIEQIGKKDCKIIRELAKSGKVTVIFLASEAAHETDELDNMILTDCNTN